MQAGSTGEAMSEKPKIIVFITVLCFICAFILATLSTTLKPIQEKAIELDRSKQLLIAAKILSPKGHFLTKVQEVYVPATFNSARDTFTPITEQIKATDDQIITIYEKDITPMLVNSKGDIQTFNQAGIDYNTYLKQHAKTGYANLPNKLIYEIKDSGYVIPINGHGLWDAIYGYLAIEKDGNTIIGITWYQQKETAGLGANITLPKWQDQFSKKLIFKQTEAETTNFADAPLGITVVKGKVADVYGDRADAKSAVDGISGASITGQGVAKAYANSLEPYRAFLLTLQNK